MRKILGFAGPKSSGKTTAYDIVRENFPEVQEITLALHMKKVCAKVFNFDEVLCHDPKLKEVLLADPISLEKSHIENIFEKFNITKDQFTYDDHIRPHVGKLLETPRQVLQYIGTEVLRPIDDLIHVKFATSNLPDNGILVVTDMRFENEFNYFKDNFEGEFYPYHINCTRAELAAEGDTHPSETDRHKFKHLCKSLDNNRSIHAFRTLVKEEVRSLYES